MKILLPVEKNETKSMVCPSFGRAPIFLVYNTETKEETYIDNEAANSAGGAGIKAAQNVVDLKVDVLITPRIGKNAADVIEAANINMVQSLPMSIEENLLRYDKGELHSLTEIHPGFHNHGAK